ncbi:uncharacterized protein LOC126578865 [Anopheles aquasalis]|uniref:uncharacterized protein LOC126578865 n=1 Tax=Anopheles aquasalis TaxID=42839 RepID=UPI00215AB2C0|nr:uncharacterized protein LOC126578865 [Anopheles aquasalis]
MHNEPALQTAREKSLPNGTAGTTAVGATTGASAGVSVLHHPNGNGAVPETGTNRTPLHEAASGGDEAKVESLLASGADRNAKESVHGNTPLHEAAWKGYSRCVNLLCALPKPAKGATTISTPGVKGLSLDLLKDAAKIKHALHDTKGALHSALLGTRNYGGFSALHLAAQNGHNQSCREILLAGGDPDVQNNYGDTPLHTACRYGHAGAIRILLSAKCDYERINLNGDTALHIACAMGRRKLTRILLESGCRQDTKNAQDETARDIALRKNLVEIINILNTPIELSPRRSRERSSSSSHQRHQSGNRPPDTTDGKHGPRENGRGHRSRSKEDPSAAATRKSGRRSNSNDERRPPGAANEGTPPAGGGNAEVADPKHWSPYGCHYFPDPRNFPSPKLETLPKEPLGNGEQYFLDLAGNIRKGPVGVGNTCYCAPFFKHLEARMNQNRRSIRKYVHRATEKLDSRMTALAMRTDDQIEELTKSMIANRVQCENKRLHLEQWLKRGIAERSTTTSGTGGTSGHQQPPPSSHTPPNSKTKKDEANTNTLTRCRSLELLDDHDRGILIEGGLADPSHKATSTPTNQQQQHHHQHHHLFSRSIDFLDATTIDDSPEPANGHRHRFQRHQGGLELDSHALRSMLHYSAGSAGHQSDAFESSNNSNMKNHSESAPETPPLPDALVHHHQQRHQRARSSSVSGRESYSYSSDKDNDREKQQQQQQQQYVHASNGVTHKQRSSANTTPTTSSGGGGGHQGQGVAKSEKAKVTERLEELLSKTKKILELEKLTKGDRIGPTTGSLIAATAPQGGPGLLSDNRYILALDKLRDIHHHHQYDPTVATVTGSGGRSGGRSGRLGLSVASSGSPGSTGLGYDIAQEMEKITKSLLPAGTTSTATSTAPVSPEIAKDITTRKERPTSVYTSYQHHQQQHHGHRVSRTTTTTTTTTGSGSPLSTMSPSSSLLGGQQQMVDEAQQHIATTNFMLDPTRTSSLALDEESEQEQAMDGDGSGGVVVNGFYSNSCFDETLPSSSNTTIKSAPRGRSGYREDQEQGEEGGDSESEPADEDRTDEDDDDDDDDDEEQEEEEQEGQSETVNGGKDTEGSDSDDPGDLSAMANLAELKELKSRILNGTNWRSQVLQKSVQELLAGGGREEDTDGPPPDEDDDPATETNRVRYIISKLQQSCSMTTGSSSEQSVRPLTTAVHTQHHGPPLAQCEDFSDSSEEEDEDEHDEECVDGPLPMKQHAVSGASQPPSMAPGKVQIEIGTAKSLIQMYEQSNGSIKVPTIGTGANHYPAPQGNAVPKDAYFHDLPRKPAPYPGQPQEVTSIMVGGEQMNAAPPMLTSRSRNPLPSYLLQEGELFQQQHQQQEHHLHHHPLMNGGGGPRTQHHHPPHQQHLGQQPAYHHHQSRPLPTTRTQLDDVVDGHSMGGPQLQERLLSTRKYINPVTLSSLSSTGTPSPEFPLYHHQQQQQHQQAQPQQLATAGTASSNHVIGGHSHAMMTMMAAAAAAAASAGRKSADNLSNDDSGYVSGKVSEIHIPSGGASPLLSLPTPAIGNNVMIIPPPAVPSSSSPRLFASSSSSYGVGGHHHHHHHQQQQQQLLPASNSGAPVMHHRNGGGSVVTSIVPPPVGLGGVVPMTSAAAHAAVEQKQQSLYKLGASSLV